jgi:predicted O-methyltransferase YrrM
MISTNPGDYEIQIRDDCKMSVALYQGIQMLLEKNKYKNVLEFGVFAGTTARCIRYHLPEEYKMYGFDSFVGLPENWENAGCDAGHFTRDGIIPDNLDGVEIHKGWFTDSIPKYLEEHQEPIGLIHIDCDLYSSTMDVLTGLNDLIVPGTILVFDEWMYRDELGRCFIDSEQRAFYDWIFRYDRFHKLISCYLPCIPYNNEKMIVEVIR